MENEFRRGLLINVNEIPQLEFDDQYEHTDSSIEYLIENELFEPENIVEKESEEYKNLFDLINSIYTKGCDCTNPSNCLTSETCIHSENYIVVNTIDNSKELILNPNRKCNDLIYECFEKCKCSSLCKNRLVQYGPRKNLKIIDTKRIPNQKGLITMKPIPMGGFICEYAGEIITKTEAERRHKNNIQNSEMNYIICLNEYCIDSSKNSISNLYNKRIKTNRKAEKVGKAIDTENSLEKIDDIDTKDASTGVNKKTRLLQTFIDPSRKGNIGRYLNHSCEPNCHILSVRVDGPVPKLGNFLNFTFIFINMN